MCITNFKAELKKTKILSFPMDNGNHYLAYSNMARNLSKGQNVMILPIPGELKQEWFYDTTKYNDYLKEISTQTRVSEDYQYGVMSKGFGRLRSATLGIDDFKVGQYTIFFSKDIEAFDKKLDENGVSFNTNLKNFYGSHYKDCTYVACLFDSNREMDAQPIAFEYTPIKPETLFFPMMDSHDGNTPKKNEKVFVDHHIITKIGKQETEVTFSQDVPDFLRKVNFGTYSLHFMSDQGDVYVDTKEKKPNLKRSYERL